MSAPVSRALKWNQNSLPVPARLDTQIRISCFMVSCMSFSIALYTSHAAVNFSPGDKCKDYFDKCKEHRIFLSLYYIRGRCVL